MASLSEWKGGSNYKCFVSFVNTRVLGNKRLPDSTYLRNVHRTNLNEFCVVFFLLNVKIVNINYIFIRITTAVTYFAL